MGPAVHYNCIQHSTSSLAFSPKQIHPQYTLVYSHLQDTDQIQDQKPEHCHHPILQLIPISQPAPTCSVYFIPILRCVLSTLPRDTIQNPASCLPPGPLYQSISSSCLQVPPFQTTLHTATREIFLRFKVSDNIKAIRQSVTC